MSESENVKRCLNQAAEMACARIQVQDNDIRQLKDKKLHKDSEIESLKASLFYADMEKRSQQKKAETSLLFMLLVGCLAVVAVTNAVLNCQ